jgi:hypothetical protein
VDRLTSLTGEPYGYAADNPVNQSDPAGLEAIPIPIVGPQDAGLCVDPVTAAACVAARGYVAAEAGKSIVNAWAGEEAGNDEGEAALHAKESERENCGEVTFGHGARRLDGTGLGQEDVEKAIEEQVNGTACRGNVP